MPPFKKLYPPSSELLAFLAVESKLVELGPYRLSGTEADIGGLLKEVN